MPHDDGDKHEIDRQDHRILAAKDRKLQWRRPFIDAIDEPGRTDDELLSFDNVVLTPHMAGSPRTNGLQDIEDLIAALARALAG